MPKILVTRNVGPDAIKLLNESGYEIILNPEDSEPSREWVLGHLRDPEVISAVIMHSQTSDKVNTEFIEACNPNLKTLSTFSVGYDHIDVKGVQAKGIRIGHTPGVLSDAVADITVMLVLMTMRRAEEGMQLVKSGEWPQLPWAPFVLCGPALWSPSLTIGFLGFGRIPQHVIPRLLAFTSKSHPPKINYLSSRQRPNQAQMDADFSKEFGVPVQRVEKDELAKTSDILILLCDLNPSTKGIVDKEFLKKMKKTAVLINCARGPVVETDDLAEALDNGTIFGAGLDVITGEPNVSPDHPLVKAKNCVVLPHLGSGDIGTRKAMADLCVRNAIAGAKGEALPAEVPKV